MRTALIDGDVLVYEAGFAAQKTRYYYNGDKFPDYETLKNFCAANEIDLKQIRSDGLIEKELEVFPEATAISIARKKLTDVLEEVGTDDFTFFLSGKDNFRDKVAVTKGYKANRDDKPKPEHYEAVKKFYLTDVWTKPRLNISVNCEADDHIAIEAFKDPTTVVCSIDKDLNQIPGRHYDWNLGIKYTVGKTDALWFFLLQLLKGDSVDNIPGIPRIGDAKARALIDQHRGDVKAAWAVVKGVYKDKIGKGWVKYMNEQGQLLWMQRVPKQKWNRTAFEKEIKNAGQ